MNNKIYSFGKFKAVIPANWVADEKENIISLYEPIKGVGALQFSLLNVENVSRICLENELGKLLENKFTEEITVIDICAQAIYLDEEENKHWKYWLFKKGNMVVFVSYNSDNVNARVRKVPQYRCKYCRHEFDNHVFKSIDELISIFYQEEEALEVRDKCFVSRDTKAFNIQLASNVYQKTSGKLY